MKTNSIQKNIPNEWQVKTVDDVALVFKGKGLSKGELDSTGENKCVLYGQLFTTYREVIKEVKSRTHVYDGVRSEKGDILIPGSTTTKAEDLAIASAILEDNVLLGGDINVLRKKGEFYDPVFLSYYLTNYKKKEIGSFGQGSTIIHLYGRDIKKIELVLPTIFEQKQIAEILSSIDEEIQKVDEVILKTEELKKGLIVKLFTKGVGHKKFKKTEIGTIPDGWGIGTLEEVTEKISVGFVGTCEPFYTNESGVPMIRTGNLKISGIDINDLKYVTNEFHKKNIKSQIKSNDILIARHGENGLACLVPNNFGEANCLNVVIVRPNLNVLNPVYLFYAINAPIVRSQIEAKTGGSTQKVVNTSSIKLVRLGIPDQEEQKEITKVLVSIDKKIELNKKLKEKLTQLKKGLMSDLLSGKVRVK